MMLGKIDLMLVLHSDKSILDAISNTIDKVDKGEIRIAEKKNLVG